MVPAGPGGRLASDALGSQVRILSFSWLTILLELSAGSSCRTALSPLLETRLSCTGKGSEEEEGGGRHSP